MYEIKQINKKYNVADSVRGNIDDNWENFLAHFIEWADFWYFLFSRTNKKGLETSFSVGGRGRKKKKFAMDDIRDLINAQR